METLTCDCGRITGEACLWHGPVDQMVTVEWMPPFHRSSHMAAGNSGAWPHNGAERLQVEASCGASIVESDPDWAWIV